jgi:hypothetical protein
VLRVSAHGRQVCLGLQVCAQGGVVLLQVRQDT